MSANSPQHIVIVGNGMVGHHFVEQVFEQAGDPASVKVTVLSAEDRLAYDRVHLSAYFSGTSAEELALTTPEQYEAYGLEVKTGCRVTAIDTESKTINTSDDDVLSYDKLVLATGSYPFVPPITGKDRDQCLVYRTLEDLDAIEAAAKKSKVGVVVGGGLLGLEAANALKNLGLETHVVEFAPQLMGVQLDQAGGKLLQTMIEDLGVQVHTQKATQQIVDGENCVHRMEFADGSFLETDVILFSAGIRPYDDLAESSGLTKGERGGFAVDNFCKTSNQDIYAIGECAAWQNFIFGLVAPGYTQARVAANNLFGGEMQFTGADMSTKLKLMGCDVGSIGDAHGKTEGALTYTYENQPEQVYKKIVVSNDGEQLLGAVLVGDTSDYDTLLQYMLNGITLPEMPESLILPSSLADKPSLGADALPDEATICSCHNVTKGDIVAQVEAGNTDLGEIKACTKASTGCGGCAALLKNVFDAELEKRGVEVDNSLCAHFNYSRPELFELVVEEKITSYDALMKKHGNSEESHLGCEICKPAVGSMLASAWNDYILKDDHLPLQDTNDNYLGNMQKDGTYSVVPRVPGGEITPDKLITIGQIAKDYDLYTKITGGQRIDLFGARVEQLPDIWQRLVDAGMETGHAYGKALRTVKSCVGSTWCRYGVQDSVGFAIDLENRYKGIRAPHKVKMAVSGCTRECAEAQSKDFGVIATENGWNLYVCGNGGMRPRHGDLFATDLDDETLVKYIDRIFMFYIHTADRLQRTSVWMENLEGGLEFLKSVVIDDALSINDKLEAQMLNLIDNYQCEWKTTIESPEKLKRFKAFVNSDSSDPNIQFVKERTQIRPATAEEKDKNRIPVVEV